MRLLSIDFTKSNEEINEQLQFNRIIAEASLYGMKPKDSYIEQSGLNMTDYTSSKPAVNTSNEMSNDDVQSEILNAIEKLSQQMCEIKSQLNLVIANNHAVRVING